MSLGINNDQRTRAKWHMPCKNIILLPITLSPRSLAISMITEVPSSVAENLTTSYNMSKSSRQPFRGRRIGATHNQVCRWSSIFGDFWYKHRAYCFSRDSLFLETHISTNITREFVSHIGTSITSVLGGLIKFR